MDHENRLEYLEGVACDTRKEDCEESDSTVASSRTAIRDKTLRLALALGHGWPGCVRENDRQQPGTGQDDHGRDSVGQVQDVGCPGPQGRGSQDGHEPNGHASDDEGRRNHGVQGGMDPAVPFHVAARGRTGARIVASGGRPRTQAAVAATSSKTTESSQPENYTSAFNEASGATSRTHDAAASRSNEEGQKSSRSEVEGRKSSSKKKRLAVPGGVVGRNASAATNVRGRKPRFEETQVPRPATSSPEEGKRAPETGISSNAVVAVSPSSSFLQDDQASGRSWSTPCSAALVVISVVLASVFQDDQASGRSWSTPCSAALVVISVGSASVFQDDQASGRSWSTPCSAALVVISVVLASVFQDDQASGRSWSTPCSAALVVISVVSASVFQDDPGLGSLLVDALAALVVISVVLASVFQDDQASGRSWSTPCSAALVVISVVSASVFQDDQASGRSWSTPCSAALVVISVVLASVFQDDQASGRSWSTPCSAALMVISVASASVFVCMSFQVSKHTNFALGITQGNHDLIMMGIVGARKSP
ncbi:hypothetical protein MTO96_027689 [Rhipicephalus appendiculatus]